MAITHQGATDAERAVVLSAKTFAGLLGTAAGVSDDTPGAVVAQLAGLLHSAASRLGDALEALEEERAQKAAGV